MEFLERLVKWYDARVSRRSSRAIGRNGWRDASTRMRSASADADTGAEWSLSETRRGSGRATRRNSGSPNRCRWRSRVAKDVLSGETWVRWGNAQRRHAHLRRTVRWANGAQDLEANELLEVLGRLPHVDLGASEVGFARIFNHQKALRREFTLRVVGIIGVIKLVAPHVRVRESDISDFLEVRRIGIGEHRVGELLLDVCLLEHALARTSNVHAIAHLFR